MTVAELIELLEDMPDDAEVRLGTQPNYPMEYTTGEVGLVIHDDEPVVYLGAGDQVGYLPDAARLALGWPAEDFAL